MCKMSVLLMAQKSLPNSYYDDNFFQVYEEPEAKELLSCFIMPIPEKCEYYYRVGEELRLIIDKKFVKGFKKSAMKTLLNPYILLQTCVCNWVCRFCDRHIAKTVGRCFKTTSALLVECF